MFYCCKTLIFAVQLLRILVSQTPPSLPPGFLVSHSPGSWFSNFYNPPINMPAGEEGGEGKPAGWELEIATSEKPKSLFYCSETFIFAAQPGSPARSGPVGFDPAWPGPARLRCIDLI